MSDSFIQFICNILIKCDGISSYIDIICKLLYDTNRQRIIQLQTETKHNYLLICIILVDNSSYNRKNKFINFILSESHQIITEYDNLLITYNKSNLNKFIMTYGITPWDCYLTYACKKNNKKLIKKFVEKGAQFCNNCFGLNHMHNIKQVYANMAQFIIKQKSSYSHLKNNNIDTIFLLPNPSIRVINKSKRIVRFN